MSTAFTAVGTDECVDALLLRVNANLPIKTGEPSVLARRNLVYTQECFIRLSHSSSAFHVSLVDGLIRILKLLIAENANNVGLSVPEVEENFRQSVHYLVETIWKCVSNSPPSWQSAEEKGVALNLFVESGKLQCLFFDRPLWSNEIDLLGKLVCELSRRSFSSVQLFVQQLFAEPELHDGVESLAGNESTNLLIASFSLVQYFNLSLSQLNLLLRDLADKTRSGSGRKSSYLSHIIIGAPYFAVLLWRIIELQTTDFATLHSSKDGDEFYDPCLRIFEACDLALSSDKAAKFGRQPLDKERIRQQLWPLKMACIVYSPKFTSGINGSNEEASNFVETLRSKMKRSHEYEFIAPILARFTSSLGRLPVSCRKEDLSRQLLPAINNDLRNYLMEMSRKPSRNMTQGVEDICVHTLCICLSLGISEPHWFKVEELVVDMLSSALVEPLQGQAGPTVVAIALKSLWNSWQNESDELKRESNRNALALATGRRVASFFTHLGTHYLSGGQSNSSSQSGGSGGSQSAYSSSRIRSVKAQNRSERHSVDDNLSPATQTLVYFLELFVAAPMLVIIPATDDPGLLSEVFHTICGLLDKPIFKKCVQAIEKLTESICWTATQPPEALNRIRMLSISFDALTKRMLQSCAPVMLSDFAAALFLLSGKLLSILNAVRLESLSTDYSFLKDTIQRFERALISRLWTTDTTTLITILDCFANLCKIVDSICQGEDMAVMQFCPNLHSYAEMSNEQRRQSVSLGRVALQKHVLTSLRTLRYPSQSVIGAWEWVFSCWVTRNRTVIAVLKGNTSANETSGPSSSPSLVSSSNSASLPITSNDSATSPGFVRSGTNSSNTRRPSNMSTSSVLLDPDSPLSIDELLVEWNHMTYYLAALADAYFKHRTYQRKTGGGSGSQTPHLTVAPSLSMDVAISKPAEDNLSVYVGDLLRMLVLTSEEKYGVRVERCVRESLGGDLRPPIQSIVIEEAYKLVMKCLDITNQVIVTDQNTLFVGNITQLFKMMLDKPSLSTRIDAQVSNILEEMISLLGQYVRVVGIPKLHVNFCALLLAVLRRREEMGYRLETKFRAKVIDYLVNFPQQTVALNDLALLQLKTMSTVLARFPIIMDPAGGNVDHSYRLKQLKLCADFIVEKSCYLYKSLPQNCSSGEVDDQSLQALQNLLLFNGDLGLGSSLCLIMAPEVRIRSAYFDALSRFIRQGIANGVTSADETTSDEFSSLAELVTMLDDRGELPVVMALVEVVPAYQLHDLARLLTHLFDAKHLLSQLVINVLTRELTLSPYDTVLRGSNLASSLLSYSFQTFGSYYIAETIGPIAKRLINFDDGGSCEVNPECLEGEANVEDHRENLKRLTREILHALINNRQRFPAKLRSLCRCVHEVLAERFPNSDVLRLTGGTLVFLRFINPFLTSSFEFGLCDRPSKHVQRTFTLVAKLLQSSANAQPLKEEFMKPLNEFTVSLRKEIDEFVDYLINNDDGAASSPAASSLFLGESVRHSLHYFLYTNQERVADCLRERRLIGRKPLDRLESLLNKLGPVELSFYLASFGSNASTMPSSRPVSQYGMQQINSDRLEPQIAEQMEKLREAKVFYHSGHSASGNPVFYMVPKHTRSLLSDFGDSFSNSPGSEALANLIVAMLKPYNAAGTKWELVVDLTQAPISVLFKSDLLQKLLSIPEIVLSNLTTIYIYQCPPVVADYARLHDRFVTYLRQNIGCRFIFPESLTELRVHVPHLKLPQTTLVLDEDSRTFSGVSKLARSSGVQMNIQTSKIAIKLATAERVRLFAGCQLFVVETFTPEDVEEIQLDSTKQQMTLILRSEPVPIILGHALASEIYESTADFREKMAIAQQSLTRTGSSHDHSHAYHSRSFLTARMAGTVPVRLRDISAFLLATGFANLSSGVPSVQRSALNLIASLCQRFDLHIDDDKHLENLLRIITVDPMPKMDKCFPPLWSSDMVSRLSLRISQSASWLLLDFIAACSYYLAAESQHSHVKAAICESLAPWLDQLAQLRENGDDQIQTCPLNDALTSLVSAFIELPSNTHLIKSVFPRLNSLFDLIFDCVLTLQTGIAHNEWHKRNNAIVILLKTAGNDRASATKVIVRYVEGLMLQFPSKMNSNNLRLLFVIRVVNAFFAEDSFATENNAETFLHFALSLVGSGVPVDGETIYSLIYNAVRAFVASTDDIQLHRSLTELSEPKFVDFFVNPDFQNSPSASLLSSETWVSLLEYLVDLVAACDKSTCNRWAEFCRQIIKSSIQFSSNDDHHISEFVPSVRISVRILGILSALPPANMVSTSALVDDVEMVLKVFAKILTRQLSGAASPNVSVGISGAISFLARLTPSIPVSLLVLLGDFFWIAAAFLISSEPSIYADALILVDTVIASLWARTSCPLETILSCYNRHETIFSQAFSAILPAATSQGLDVRDHIHYVLARLLFKSVYHPENGVCSFAARLLLRLHQPSSNNSVFADESERAKTVVYSLVGHIIMPDHASRNARRQTRTSSVASNSASTIGNLLPPTSVLNNIVCGCWEDRLADVEKLSSDEKVLCCEFLFSLLLASSKNLPAQQPILVSISRLFAAGGSDFNRAVALTRLPEVKAQLAEILRTTHDPDTLIAAQNLLEHVTPVAQSNQLMESSLFASLHRIPMTFGSSASSTLLSALPSVDIFYGQIASIIFEGALKDCSFSAQNDS